jgi:hypothetical protein
MMLGIIPWHPRALVDGSYFSAYLYYLYIEKMWSYIQRRQIANQVRLDYQKDAESIGDVKTLTAQKRFLSLSSVNKRSEEGSQQGASNERHFQVQSIGEDDPLNPLNWPRAARAKNIFIICFLVFTQCWAGSADRWGIQCQVTSFT